MLGGGFAELVQGFSGARWQSGYAAACKAVYAGSIPTLASITHRSVPVTWFTPYTGMECYLCVDKDNPGTPTKNERICRIRPFSPYVILVWTGCNSCRAMV